MPIATDELSVNAKGGTEIMKNTLTALLDPELMKEVQIFCSRIRGDLDPTKIRLFWAHDLPGDPESEFLKGGGWKDFHRIVFVSNWQMQAYMNHYQIPWSKCIVIQNAVFPIEEHEKPKDKINLIYYSTPHRGLNILVPVFERLAQEHDNIELNVYSSFSLYGWTQRDEPYKEIFDRCNAHPKINYHGAVDNETIRQALKQSHILSYPSIWPETSCLVLMEAMTAGLINVHPNFAALPETAANWSMMYQWNEDQSRHAGIFYQNLKSSIENFWDEGVQSRLASQRSYANVFYNWNIRVQQWDAFIRSLLNEPRELLGYSKTDVYHYKA
jgi:glycosyltransferase involved in cell wall biosynthesis